MAHAFSHSEIVAHTAIHFVLQEIDKNMQPFVGYSQFPQTMVLSIQHDGSTQCRHFRNRNKSTEWSEPCFCPDLLMYVFVPVQKVKGQPRVSQLRGGPHALSAGHTEIAFAQGSHNTQDARRIFEESSCAMGINRDHIFVKRGWESEFEDVLHRSDDRHP